MTGTQSLLCEMLSCGTMDLELLDRVRYDWDEVLEQLDWPCGEGFTFNRLMRAVVDVGTCGEYLDVYIYPSLLFQV